VMKLANWPFCWVERNETKKNRGFTLSVVLALTLLLLILFSLYKDFLSKLSTKRIEALRF